MGKGGKGREVARKERIPRNEHQKVMQAVGKVFGKQVVITGKQSTDWERCNGNAAACKKKDSKVSDNPDRKQDQMGSHYFIARLLLTTLKVLHKSSGVSLKAKKPERLLNLFPIPYGSSGLCSLLSDQPLGQWSSTCPAWWPAGGGERGWFCVSAGLRVSASTRRSHKHLLLTQVVLRVHACSPLSWPGSKHGLFSPTITKGQPVKGRQVVLKNWEWRDRNAQQHQAERRSQR